MSGDATMQALTLALVLILPLSALIARRLPLSITVKYAAAWLAFFLIGLVIMANFT